MVLDVIRERFGDYFELSMDREHIIRATSKRSDFGFRFRICPTVEMEQPALERFEKEMIYMMDYSISYICQEDTLFDVIFRDDGERIIAQVRKKYNEEYLYITYATFNGSVHVRRSELPQAEKFWKLAEKPKKSRYKSDLNICSLKLDVPIIFEDGRILVSDRLFTYYQAICFYKPDENKIFFINERYCKEYDCSKSGKAHYPATQPWMDEYARMGQKQLKPGLSKELVDFLTLAGASQPLYRGEWVYVDAEEGVWIRRQDTWRQTDHDTLVGGPDEIHKEEYSMYLHLRELQY